MQHEHALLQTKPVKSKYNLAYLARSTMSGGSYHLEPVDYRALNVYVTSRWLDDRQRHELGDRFEREAHAFLQATKKLDPECGELLKSEADLVKAINKEQAKLESLNEKLLPLLEVVRAEGEKEAALQFAAVDAVEELSNKSAIYFQKAKGKLSEELQKMPATELRKIEVKHANEYTLEVGGKHYDILKSNVKEPAALRDLIFKYQETVKLIEALKQPTMAGKINGLRLLAEHTDFVEHMNKRRGSTPQLMGKASDSVALSAKVVATVKAANAIKAELKSKPAEQNQWDYKR